MAAPEGRSLSASVSIPQWMKNKMNSYDFDQSAFSPTEIDDSYLRYYRYPREQSSETNNNNNNNVQGPTNKPYTPDASKYTLPCQKYLKNGNDCATAQRVVHPVPAKTKSSGVDDGFKGEAAKCGSSIISLAHMMVSRKSVLGFDVESQESKNKEHDKLANNVDTPPEGFNPMVRRGSKSLPASPLGSPRNSPSTRRRMNKYFTGPFVESEKHQGNWILSSLLAQREKIPSQSCDTIAEDESEDAKSLSPNEMRKSDAKKKSVLVPKPSELREMNFWSPTSM